ncbi:monocarboxylate transporter 9 [Anabrus simplex]|uniref:monocarboxylate transporter 9 n=1 Tax=Anabrus simplex TaxID=316456 RepID=UPI0035A3462D
MMPTRPAAPQPDGGWSWLIVVGNIIINLSLLPLVQCFGLLFEDKFQVLGITTTETSFLLHLNSSFTCALGLLSAPLLRRFSYRIIALLACGIACAGVCLTSFANSMVGFILTYCALLGLGQGILYPATSLALNSHFKQRRSMAMGLTIAATGLGPIVTPQIATFLLDKYGTSGTVLLFGGGALHSLIGAALLRPVPQPPHHNNLLPTEVGEVNPVDCPKPENADETQPEVQPFINSSSASKTPTVNHQTTGKPCLLALKRLCNNVAQALDLALLKDPIYLSIVAGMGISFVAELNFNLLIPFILAELAKMPRASVATIMSVQAVADISARLLVPLGADTWHWSARTLYILSLLGSILGRSVLAHFHSSLSLLLALAVLLGIAKGIKAVFQALIIPNYVPLEKLPAASGLLMVINGILSISLGPFIGFVRDASSSHIVALYTTSAMSLFCVLLWGVEALVSRHLKSGDSEDHSVNK